MVNPIVALMTEKTDLRKTGRKILLNDAKSLLLLSKISFRCLTKKQEAEVKKTIKVIAGDIKMVMQV